MLKLMDFGEALNVLKQGGKVVRKNWGGDELYIQVDTNTTFNGEPVTPTMVIKTTAEGYSPFAPTVCDVLAEDWVCVND